jgi:hypothetical protein
MMDAHPLIVNCASVGLVEVPPSAGAVQLSPPEQPPVAHVPDELQPVRPQTRPLYPDESVTVALPPTASEKPPVLAPL